MKYTNSRSLLWLETEVSCLQYDLEFKKTNCEEITLDAEFDIAVSFETIEHLKNNNAELTDDSRKAIDDKILSLEKLAIANHWQWYTLGNVK